MMCMLTRGPEENLLSFSSPRSSLLPARRSHRMTAPVTSALPSVCHHLRTHLLGATNESWVDMFFLHMSACVIVFVYLKVVLCIILLWQCCLNRFVPRL